MEEELCGIQYHVVYDLYSHFQILVNLSLESITLDRITYLDLLLCLLMYCSLSACVHI